MLKKDIKILIAAGGSGGHIFPGVALAKALKAKTPGIDIRFVASDKALDRRILGKEGFRFSLLSANSLPFKPSFEFLIFFIKLIGDLAKSFFLIARYRPNCVIGFGGYCSCPIVFASYVLRAPRVVHEQNVAPSRSNAFMFRLSDRIALSFNETCKYVAARDRKKIVFTGNPIRREGFKNDRRFGIKQFGLNENKFTILVMGGSQGAHNLNKTFINAVAAFNEDFKKRLQVIHLTGIADYEWALGDYKQIGIEHRVYSFIDRIEEAYSASDLVLTRSGASAIFEVAFLGKPMILVPYPYALSHQLENAKVFCEHGAAIKIEESEIGPEMLRGNISDLIADNGRLGKLGEAAKRMSIPQASDNLAKEVMNLACH